MRRDLPGRPAEDEAGTAGREAMSVWIDRPRALIFFLIVVPVEEAEPSGASDVVDLRVARGGGRSETADRPPLSLGAEALLDVRECRVLRVDASEVSSVKEGLRLACAGNGGTGKCENEGDPMLSVSDGFLERGSEPVLEEDDE